MRTDAKGAAPGFALTLPSRRAGPLPLPCGCCRAGEGALGDRAFGAGSVVDH